MSLWLANALLVAVTLLLLLRPLLRKSRPVEAAPPARRHAELLDQRLEELERERDVELLHADEYAQARRETKHAYDVFEEQAAGGSVAQRVPTAAVVAVVAAMLAAGLSYFYFSDGYRLLHSYRNATVLAQELAALTDALEQRLAARPQDLEARLRLANAKYLIGDYAAAASEYHRLDKAGALAGEETWLNYADAVLRTGDMTHSERVLAGLKKVLASDPDHRRALFFSGLLRFERNEHTSALTHWRRLLALLPPDDAVSRNELDRLIERAQAGVSQPPSDVVQTDSQTREQNAAYSGPVIKVMVSLSQDLHADPDDTVFVYARAISGPPMPLAIARLTAAELPVEVRLDNRSTMMEGMNLDTFKQVEIVARISKQGRATPTAGDLIGTLAPVTPGRTVRLEISRRVE